MRPLLALCAAVSLHAAGRPVDFQREIRPLLSDACFACHGPDKNTRLGNLRLDTRDGAFEVRKTGAAIVPGKPDESLILQRVNHAKDAMRMPPAATKKTLTAAQKGLLRTWIEQGAPWKEHWSFVPPTRPAAPAVRNAAWIRTPIDRFLLAKIEAAGLRPAPEADRRALLRRVSLDLTGLPPTAAAIDEVLADKSAGAYEKAVDRLLASERFGEHRGRYWLDAARYGDTHGIHVDNYREMWPYRDWVIGAFNANVPFDRFTIEQIAGDLIPNRTQQHQIASGFHRCNVTTNEGGSIPDEVAAMYAKDRVDTTATVWLGLTAGCASCHDHKFDPIAQREFYQMAAFFRNTTQNPMDGNIPDTPPVLFVPKSEDESRWNELKAEATRLADAKKARQAAAGAEFEARTGATPEEPLASANLFSIDANRELPAGISRGDGPAKTAPALRFGEKAAINLPAPAGFDLDKPFTIAAWVLMPKGEDSFTAASQTVPKPSRKDDDDDGDTVPKGWAIEINARIPQLRLGGNGSIRATGNNINRLKPGEWAHLVFTYDGSRDQRGLRLYINGKSSGAPARGANIGAAIKESIAIDAPVRLGGEAKRYFAGGAIAGFRIYSRAVRPEEAAILASWNALREGTADRDTKLAFFLNREDEAYRKLDSELAGVEQEQALVQSRAAVTLVMQEKADSAPMANILYRGQYDQPRDKVTPATPSVLPPMAASLPRDRMGLAKWLMDPSNPLTARVTVNRMWQEVFGTGIVKTAEDFGSQGQTPSHPELLDWLAIEFRDTGWDMKKMYKLIVMSAAYRQSAAATDEKLRKDPENRLLSRGPRFRMDGEMVRDLFLAASGSLNPVIGGPSVKPYQPDGIWETVAMRGSNTRFYKQDHGEALYRRGMYTFWKRSAPPASMEIFNAPTRETCTVRRERTNTPLQALVTLNDPQMVEAARRMAERSIESGKTFDQRLDAMTSAAIARPLNARERTVVRKALADLLSHYDSKPAEAKRLLAVGESKANPSLAPPEFAAWTMIASNILNLDEALNK